MFSPIPFLAAVVQDDATAAVAFDLVAQPLAVAAGLAIAVERVLELLKNATDLFPGPAGGGAGRTAAARAEPIDRLEAFHTTESERARAEEHRARIELEAAARSRDLSAAERAELDALGKLLDSPGSDLRALELEEAFPPETILVQEATDADDGSALRSLTLQLVAAALGILAARVFDVRLFDALTPVPLALSVDYLMTGLVIGGGSGPVHMLIRFIGERKLTIPAPAERDEEVAVVARTQGVTVSERAVPPAPPPAGWQPPPSSPGGAPGTASAAVEAGPDTAWIEIPYRGGVDRERLESVHRRRRDPDTIIYHHTAMNRSSTFEDVVRVIRDRRDSRGNPWITGYNCVVTGDGAVHPFCRWDRYGNHAAGWNARSLGIALNGNFETDPGVPFSNPDGRYGPSRPSQEQLEAAARVVALWATIYDIELDFGERIIPHSKVSPKTCPGNDFPYERFESLVRRFHAGWSSGPDRAHVEAFDRLPHLHV
ncbi:MAG: peptidoglycan recognition protein family protein [Gemmatimonadetes bacterium]|nr:peptidoglycan recognition protein family protein [Gemmatimonadota bacterium]